MTTSLGSQIRAAYIAHGSDWTKPGFRAIAVYRFGVWRMGVSPKILRAPLSIVYRWAFRYCRNRYGIELPYSAEIGEGVIIEHQSGIVVHGATKIGANTIIRQNCTMGIKDLSDLGGAPVIGCNVDIGAGAVILGRITIGDGAVIGANAVVIRDVPPFHLAVGVPAVVKPISPR